MSNAAMSRRKALGAIAGAPLAADVSAGSLLDAQRAASMSGAVYGQGLMSGPDMSLKMVALRKAGLLPDWFVRQGKKRIDDAARVLDHDLAALGSVSPSAKFCIQRRRLFDRDLDHLEQDALDKLARAKFMGWIS